MSSAYTGGCACRAIRYEIDGEPIAMLDCQCRQCQHESGSGHASYLTFADANAKIDGEAKQWTLVGDGGTVKAHGFCPECGSPVFLTFPAMPNLLVVHAASLDDPSRYAPQMVTWTASGQPWDVIAPGLTRFEKMPPR